MVVKETGCDYYLPDSDCANLMSLKLNQPLIRRLTACCSSQNSFNLLDQSNILLLYSKVAQDDPRMDIEGFFMRFQMRSPLLVRIYTLNGVFASHLEQNHLSRFLEVIGIFAGTPQTRP